MHKKDKNKAKNSEKSKYLTGIIKITAKPIGFVTPLSDEPKARNLSEDIVVFEENLNSALDKDEVEVEIIGKDPTPPKLRGASRFKGRIVRVIKRNKTRFVGTVERVSSGLIFRPDDFKFYREVDISDFPKDLESGTKILAEVSWSNPALNPRGKIISVIGKKGEHETEMQSILLDKGILYNFPPEVEKEAEKVAEEFRESQKQNSDSSSQGGFHGDQNFVSGFPEVNSGEIRTYSPSLGHKVQGSRDSSSYLPSPASRGGAGGEVVRRDFRSITTFTIDPKDAKDFDDALSYEELGEGKIRVGVHIADVSHFVRPGSALDREALERSFSTYLVDRTIPMLPEVLSNELCSLMPNVDRFAFSAVFDIKKETGEILDRWFGKTIINSDKRFSYEEAQEVLDKSQNENSDSSSQDGSHGAQNFHSDFRGELFELNRIANIYREENKKNGAIEFETEEVRFELDSAGKPIRIYKKPRLDTMKMIEEWMLLANREVARFISDKIGKKGGAGIFRIHNLPKMDRIEELAIFVRALGHELPIKNGTVSAKDINVLLKQIEGHASESLIKTATIRSMAKAVYSTKNIGHFGLAFQYYTHFTSPIRRYPDLMVHRILERYLTNQPIPKDEFIKFERIAQEASDKEVIVAEAERDSIKYKQVEFMQDKVGQEFDVVISGVTEWGMYVENPETKVEGLVRIKDLGGDFFKLDQKNYCIIGTSTGKKFSLGDSVRVRLAAADLDRKTLDFKLV